MKRAAVPPARGSVGYGRVQRPRKLALRTKACCTAASEKSSRATQPRDPPASPSTRPKLRELLHQRIFHDLCRRVEPCCEPHRKLTHSQPRGSFRHAGTTPHTREASAAEAGGWPTCRWVACVDGSGGIMVPAATPSTMPSTAVINSRCPAPKLKYRCIHSRRVHRRTNGAIAKSYKMAMTAAT